jgi:hypothetical protein
MSSEVQAKWMNRHRGDFALSFVFPESTDRLDVVVGGCLNGLDALGIGHRKGVGDAVEQRDGVSGKRRHFGNRGFCRQRLQPFDLDDDTVPDQRKLAEEIAQRRGLAAVAAIQGGEGSQCGQFHRYPKSVLLVKTVRLSRTA